MPELTPDEAALVERLADTIVKRQLAVPAVLFLESSKPLAFLAGQALHGLDPLLRGITERLDPRVAASIFDDREKIELLLQRIEDAEQRRLESLTEGAGPAPRGEAS